MWVHVNGTFHFLDLVTSNKNLLFSDKLFPGSAMSRIHHSKGLIFVRGISHKKNNTHTPLYKSVKMKINEEYMYITGLVS